MYGIPWHPVRVEGCICPCSLCIDSIGWDPNTPCLACPVSHEDDPYVTTTEIVDVYGPTY